MWLKEHPNRAIFLTVSLSFVILVTATSLLVWHLLTPSPTSPSPKPPQATCGTIFMRGSVQPPQEKQQIENCFSHAYQQCKALTMKAINMGVDTGGWQALYWPYQQGKTCQIAVQWKSTTGTCQSMISQNGGLLFQHCSNNRDMFIPWDPYAHEE